MLINLFCVQIIISFFPLNIISFSALGASLARVFSRNGYRIVLLARTKSAIDSVVAEIVAVGGSARAFAVDLSDPSAVSTVTNRFQ